MKSSYEERAEKFIHQIYDYIVDCADEDQFEEAVAWFNITHHRKVHFSHGLTRVCFITSDYVVKYDFGSFHDLERFGTCESEIRMYELAEREGFGYLFAKPTLVVYRGKRFMIMPRVYGIGKYDYDADEYLTVDEADWVLDHVYDLHNHNYGWKNGHPVIFDYACCLYT